MATAVVSFGSTGLPPILDKLAGLEARARDFSQPLALVAKLLEGTAVKAFETQGQSLGSPWRALAPATVTARTRRWGYYRRASSVGGPSWPILVWSGRLLGGFQLGSPDHVREISAFALRWGTRVPYAAPLSRARPMVAFRSDFARREVIGQPLRLWLQGVPLGAIETVVRARTRL